MLELRAKDLKGYSLKRVIDCGAQGRSLDGIELEMHQEAERNATERAGGVLVPWQVFHRDLTVSTFSQGGAMVGLDILSPIDVLRNRCGCFRLGAQLLTGLQGAAAFPRKTATSTVVSAAETATLTKSTPGLDQVVLAPHRVGAWVDYSRQLMLQSSVDVEAWLRDDLLQTIAVKWDYLMLQGAGANSEPTGILNTAGISSLVFGATATWANVILFETDLAAANADATNGSFGYMTTPTVRGKWKNIAKIGSTFPVFLWETVNRDDGTPDGVVNGYRAVATNQILNNAVVFGNWREVLTGVWGQGPDIIVNPYSRDTDAVVRVTVNTFIDVGVRHAPSFCWSADSGAQ